LGQERLGLFGGKIGVVWRKDYNWFLGEKVTGCDRWKANIIIDSF
jgi:hypothetical protein